MLLGECIAASKGACKQDGDRLYAWYDGDRTERYGFKLKGEFRLDVRRKLRGW